MPTRRALTAIAAASLAPLASPPFAVGALGAVEIVDRSRHVPLVTFHHRGNAGVAGRPGDRDAVRLTNRSVARVLVVLSIDGVNADSGGTAARPQRPARQRRRDRRSGVPREGARGPSAAVGAGAAQRRRPRSAAGPVARIRVVDACRAARAREHELHRRDVLVGSRAGMRRVWPRSSGAATRRG